MVRVCAARIPPLEPEEFSDELRERFDSGPDTLFVFAAGQYTLLAMTLNSFGVQPESGLPGFDLRL